MLRRALSIGSGGRSRAPSPAFASGLVAQTASSAGNFALTVLAGRALGPAGLGTVFVGFSAYLIAAAIHRALVVEPLVARSAAAARDQRRAASGRAATTSLAFAAALAIAMAAAGTLASDGIGRGLLLFAPWIVPALLQDLWRSILFRDGRGRAGAANDLLWLGVLLLAIPGALAIGTTGAIVGAWGVGALAAALLGMAQTRVQPVGRLARGLVWWRADAWPLGRWLAAESGVSLLGAHVLALLLGAILGTQDLGGFRAAQSLYAPVTLLAPALTLPALPHLARQAAESPAAARRSAAGIGGLGAALALIYVATAVLLGDRLLGWVFGSSFQAYGSLVWPFGVGQTAVAATLGATVLLKARGDGTGLVGGRAIGSVVTAGLGASFAVTMGVEAATWGIAIGTVAGGAAHTAFAMREPRRPPSPPALTTARWSPPDPGRSTAIPRR